MVLSRVLLFLRLVKVKTVRVASFYIVSSMCVYIYAYK